MKRLILVILFLISITSLAESQTRLKFGNVILKDTLTGTLTISSGDLFIRHSKIKITSGDAADAILDFNNSAALDALIKKDGTTVVSITGTTNALTFWQDAQFYQSDVDIDYSLDVGTNLTVGDNLTADSIFTTRTSGVIPIQADDTLITITSSVMMISSDDGTATNRTFTISDGTTNGQTLTIILWEEGGTDKCELVDAGSEAGLDGTMLFDADMDNISLIWYTSYWIELARVEH